MRNAILIIVFISLNNALYAQTESYPQGLYMDLQEVIDKAASKNHSVELEERSPGKIKMNGGNDYQINSLDKEVKRTFFL